MEVQVLSEHGHEEALRAMSLSYYDEQQLMGDWWEKQHPRAVKRAAKMAHQYGGHNDFLTLTTVYLEIHAPLFLWKQLDRYQIGFRKLSTSTMHTLQKTGVDASRFEYLPKFFDMEAFNEWLESKPPIEEIANELPDGFLQRRIVCTNYMTLKNIVRQRGEHRLPQWQEFCRTLRAQLRYPEWLEEPSSDV